MTKRVKYIQCEMKRTIVDGLVRTISFIPQRFAKLGRVLKLKNEHDQWVDGWTVEFVGNTVVDSADAPDYRKAIRRHRKSTGDSQRRLKR